MSAAPDIRLAKTEDAAICARIVWAWTEDTEWMPKTHSEAELCDFIAKAMPEREIYLIGEPALGYLSINPARDHIGALYVSRPGEGLGQALIARAKEGRKKLRLNTHEPNKAAHRFYAREGFKLVDRIESGTDGLPELVMEWRRDA